MNSADVKEFGLVIIESLSEKKKTGFELFSSTIKYKNFEFPILKPEYYEIEDRKNFFWLLKELVRKATTENYFFILHIEAHGTEDGIVLKDKDEVIWGEMLPYFQEINTHYRNSFMIVLGVCKGANIINYINPIERAPFRALISSEKDIYLTDLIPGFEKFYENFFFELDGVEALKKYNSVLKDSKNNLIYLDCSYLFDQVTDIDRETADVNKLKEIYKNRLLFQFPDIKYFTEEHTNNYIENSIKLMFDEAKTKKSYFMMDDLKQ